MNKQNLKEIALKLVAKGKGILAADESTSTAGKRLSSIGMENTEENRRLMREMFFGTPRAAEYISGVILFDETLRQKGSDGVSFVAEMQKHGVIPGIKVDEGLEDAFEAGEKVTKGLETLDARLKEYYALGARFAKWRAVYSVSEILPSEGCVLENSKRLATYARLCQENGIVPIVEPEVLMDADGCMHSLPRSLEVTTHVHKKLFEALAEEGVYLEGLLLKPSMVIAGKECVQKHSVEEVAAATLNCLRNSVPEAVPGIVFLSGGQTSVEATAHLNEMNKASETPWALSFSYGRALQASALAAWAGKPENVEKARRVFLHRAKANSLASLGKWDATFEKNQEEAA